MSTGSGLDIQPLTGALGAEILGPDLSAPLSSVQFAAVHAALLQYGVIFFRDQSLSREAQMDFTRRFGPFDRHPIAKGLDSHPDIIRIHKAAGDSATFGVGWHSDNSYMETPSLGSVLYGEVIPPVGGDTLFANQYLAYETLSAGMKRLLAGVRAVHSAARAFTAPTTKDKWDGKTTLKYEMSDALYAEVVHPVVRTHPETGRKALYVNPMFTLRFEDMSEDESRPLLHFLFEHATRPEITCRFRWRKGSVAVWDNRCVQHNAMGDYDVYERIMYRVTIKGDRPQ